MQGEDTGFTMELRSFPQSPTTPEICTFSATTTKKIVFKLSTKRRKQSTKLESCYCSPVEQLQAGFSGWQATNSCPPPPRTGHLKLFQLPHGAPGTVTVAAGSEDGRHEASPKGLQQDPHSANPAGFPAPLPVRPSEGPGSAL